MFPLWCSGLRIWYCLCSGSGSCWGAGSIPNLAQWVKDPEGPQLWRRPQLRLRFNPWPRNFRMLWVWPKKKKKKILNKFILTITCLQCIHSALTSSVYMKIPLLLHYEIPKVRDRISPLSSSEQTMVPGIWSTITTYLLKESGCFHLGNWAKNIFKFRYDKFTDLLSLGWQLQLQFDP